MGPLSTVMVMVVVMTLPFTTHTTRYNDFAQDYENPEDEMEWEDVEPIRRNDNQDPIPPDWGLQEWIQKQLARPINKPLMDKLVVDMAKGEVDEEYWNEFLERLEMNEGLQKRREQREWEYNEGNGDWSEEENEEEVGRENLEEVNQGKENEWENYEDYINWSEKKELEEKEGEDLYDGLVRQGEKTELADGDFSEEYNSIEEQDEVGSNIRSSEENIDSTEDEVKLTDLQNSAQELDDEEAREKSSEMSMDDEDGVTIAEADEELDYDLINNLVKDFDFSLGCEGNCNGESEMVPNEGETLRRFKRSPRSSRSRSRGSSRSSSSTRRSSSSGSSGGGGWGRRTSSTSSTTRVSKPSTTRNTGTSSTNSGGSTSNTGSSGSVPSTSIGNRPPPGWNTGANRPGTNYPTSTNPQSGYPGSRPGSTYPTGTNPQPGYPGAARPGSTYPTGTNPQPGYPGAARPGSTYPTGTNPQSGYPGARPGANYPTGTNPQPGYPGGSTYPTGTNPQPGYPGAARPGSTYPTGTNPQPGYPGAARPGSTYPTGTNPQPGYPGAARPGSTYPTGTNPQSGYPGARPGANYPTGTNPQPGYPGGRPGSTYPTGTNPQPGYPGQRPGENYPTSTNPQPGYPGYRPGSNLQPAPGYPAGRQPFGVHQPYGPPSTSHSNYGGFNSFGQPHNSYSGSYRPYGGFPTSNRHLGYGAAAGGIMGASRFSSGGFGGYPVGGYPKPMKKKKGLKNKIKDGIKVAATAYVAHKAAKKASKFFSPSPFGGFGGYGGYGRGYGGIGRMGGFGHSMGGFGHRGLGGGLAGGMAGLAIAKTGKKLLGAYIKFKIASYALKFGVEAAKLYFHYKMGLELDEYMVAKFVHRYHQHRVRGDSRMRYYHHHSRHKPNNNGVVDNSTVQLDDITLGEFCQRPCEENDTRICQFTFDVDLYQSMSRACHQCPTNESHCDGPECITADGTRRMVITINKGIPGPAIQVCVGDKVYVDVMNNHPSSAVSLHWHGLTLAPSPEMPDARRTPYMDGTAGVTQCPIPPGSGFRYSFFATNPGTHFWRAQTGLQQGDGLYGPLIIHQSPQKDPNQFLAEHILLISDWYHKTQDSLWSQRHTSGKLNKPQALLINGKGANVVDRNAPQVPTARLVVENGTRYRVRVLNTAVSNCPVTLHLDSHDFILLAVDGARVNPVNTTSLLIYPGERYDVMFTAEQGLSDDGTTYWLQVQGGGACSDLVQYAGVQYLPTNFTFEEDMPELPPIPTTSSTNDSGAFSGQCGTEGQRCLPHLSSSVALPDPLKVLNATHTFYLALTLSLVHNPNYYNLLYYDGSEDQPEDLVSTPQINYLSFRAPPKPLLSDTRALRSENCSSKAVKVSQCTAGYCECVHALVIPLGSIVDLVLIADVNPSGPNEPIHLHGYKFWLLSQVGASDLPPDPPTPAPPTTTTAEPPTMVPGPPSDMITTTTPQPPTPQPPPPSLRYKVVEWDKMGKLERKLTTPVQKDTVAVPPGGYSVIRFNADNPGVWLLESEVSFQTQGGMSLVLQVGGSSDVPSKPPPDFPTC